MGWSEPSSVACLVLTKASRNPLQQPASNTLSNALLVPRLHIYS
jgi:hypothetical protein